MKRLYRGFYLGIATSLLLAGCGGGGGAGGNYSKYTSSSVDSVALYKNAQGGIYRAVVDMRFFDTQPEAYESVNYSNMQLQSISGSGCGAFSATVSQNSFTTPANLNIDIDIDSDSCTRIDAFALSGDVQYNIIETSYPEQVQETVTIDDRFAKSYEQSAFGSVTTSNVQAVQSSMELIDLRLTKGTAGEITNVEGRVYVEEGAGGDVTESYNSLYIKSISGTGECNLAPSPSVADIQPPGIASLSFSYPGAVCSDIATITLAGLYQLSANGAVVNTETFSNTLYPSSKLTIGSGNVMYAPQSDSSQISVMYTPYGTVTDATYNSEGYVESESIAGSEEAEYVQVGGVLLEVDRVSSGVIEFKGGAGIFPNGYTPEVELLYPCPEYDTSNLTDITHSCPSGNFYIVEVGSGVKKATLITPAP